MVDPVSEFCMSTSQVNQYEYLFVYGTLRPPQSHTPAYASQYFPQIAPYLVSHAPARVLNAELYSLGAYPAAVAGEGTVVGDLLTL